MDVIYTDTDWADLGVLPQATSDWAFGSSENDFEITLPRPPYPERGALVYVEDSDLGGIVTGLESSSDSTAITVTGVTWTGVMGRKVVGPDSGSDYLTLSGDVSDVVSQLLSRADLDSLFEVASHKTGINISHTFTGNRTDTTQQDAGRYMTCWAAIWQVLRENECKLLFDWRASTRTVQVTVTPADDRTDDESAGIATVKVTRSTPVNHLICLGKGELKDRAVAHVYLDADGNATTTQHYTGYQEVADTYEDNNDEGDALVTAGKKKIAELYEASQSVEVNAGLDVLLDLGDIIGGTDEASGIEATATITKKVVQSKGTRTSYTYATTVNE